MTVHHLFYVHQRVKCVDDQGAENLLRAGRFYSVAELLPPHAGPGQEWRLRIVGSDRYLRAERFVPRSVADTEIDGRYASSR